MPLIAWSPNHRVGVKALDAQHEGLLQQLNLIDEALQSKNEDLAHQQLNAFIAILKKHFLTEENYLKSHAYPGLSKQKQAHIELSKRYGEIQQSLKDGKTTFNSEVVLQLANILLDHLNGADKAYGEFLRHAGVL